MATEQELKKQIEYWKQLAIDFADIHAANPEGNDSRCKNLPKGEKMRYLSILRRCIDGLKGDLIFLHPVSKIEDVISRCEKNKKFYE